jgi:hypothetical protein
MRSAPDGLEPADEVPDVVGVPRLILSQPVPVELRCGGGDRSALAHEAAGAPLATRRKRVSWRERDRAMGHLWHILGVLAGILGLECLLIKS